MKNKDADHVYARLSVTTAAPSIESCGLFEFPEYIIPLVLVDLMLFSFCFYYSGSTFKITFLLAYSFKNISLLI